MSTPVILISILLIMAVFVPFFILNKSGKGDAKLISRRIRQIVKEDRLKFDEKESWGNTFIAIDKAQKTIVFSKTVNHEVVIEKIDLGQVEKSSIQKKLQLEKTNAGNSNILQNLDLEVVFLGHQKEKEVILLNFYNVGNTYAEDYEMQRAEKWNTVINEAVRALSNGKKVA